MKAQIIFGGIILGAALRCNALEAGDVMVVGYISDGTDSVAFVPWMELATGETITVTDARYEGGGSGADEDSGEGVDGGTYVQANSNLVWTNSTGSPIAPGTVIVVSEGSASLGTVSGNLRLTNNGEQFFLIQGSFNGSNNLIGDLLFGVDYEGSTAWAGGTNESVLPTALTSANAVDFNDTDNCQYSGQRTGAELETGYRTLVSNPSNWTALSASLDTSALNTTAFVATVIPPVVVPDELGQVSDGLLFYARRMNNKLPVLDEAWSLAQGAASTDADNLNGPCCVRLPSWLAAGDRVDPTAEYYLYFADHGGDYIRMAWAPTLEGPWTGYKMSNSLPLIQRGVLSLGSDGIISPGNQIEVNGHIASPQVFIDDVNQRFLMYYHGPTDQNGSDRGQSTLAAISPFGLNFNMPGADGGVAGYGTYPVILGESYFKVFEQAGDFYAFSNTGDIWKCPDPANPFSPPGGYNYASDYWKRGPSPFNDETESRGFVDWGGGYGSLRPRHFGVLTRDGSTYAFFTNKAASPERIKVSTFDFDDLPADYNSWKGDFPNQELIRPEETWEGSSLPFDISEAGSSTDEQHQLRDPDIMEDRDGRTYMFYSGMGEKAIGLTQIVSLPVVSGSTEVTTGEDHTFTVATDMDVTSSMLKIVKSVPTSVEFGAEDGEAQEMIHAGNSIAYEQSSTVNDGAKSYILAHDASGQSATLTFPDRYYARPGVEFEFNSRMGSSTTGQFAEFQISFDGAIWQTLWIKQGGSTASLFSTVSVDVDGLVGRTFEMRFRYSHETLRNTNFQSGTSSGRGWFFDQIKATGLEAVTDVSDAPFTAASFTLDEITPLLDPFLTSGDLEDRFLLSVEGLHSGTGFSESTGYGKPFVIRVRSSFEQFQDDYFTEIERADPLISGMMADPDNDGIVNLLEHVFGTSPQLGNGSQVTIKGGASPTIHFPWNPDAAYTYQLQMGTELDDFEDIEFTEMVTTVGEMLSIQLSPAPSVPDPGPRAFFRVKVE